MRKLATRPSSKTLSAGRKHDGSEMPWQRRTVIVGLLLLGATIVAYGEVVTFEFVDYDDPLYVTENVNVREGLSADGVAWAFTTRHFGIWHPVTWLSHMTDCELFGVRADRHHLVNLVLQSINVLLLFSLLRQMTGALGPSAFVAALFAVHPLHVESVAWVSERKDLLTWLFGLLSVRAYVAYAKNGRVLHYGLSAAMFALALMSKPMLVTLPMGLLLLDYWPLGRLRFGTDPPPEPRQRDKRSAQQQFECPRQPLASLLVEKVPLLALSAGASGMAIFAESTRGSLPTTNVISFDLRLANALVSYVRYIGKMIWPTDLSVLYPHPNFPGGAPWSAWQIVGAAALLLAVTAIVIWRATRQKYLIAGWLWYLGMLVPAIGLIQVGRQAMADHFAYVPLIGLYIIIAWGAAEWTARWPDSAGLRRAMWVAAALLLVSLTVSTRAQARHWRNSLALYEQAVAATPDNPSMHYNLGRMRQTLRQFDLARRSYDKAIELNPAYAQAFQNRGAVYLELKQFQPALEDFGRAIELNPESSNAYGNRALLYLRSGQHMLAISDYDQVIELDPHSAENYYNRGLAYKSIRQFGPAISDFTTAIRIQPDDAEAYHNRANSYQQSGQHQLALLDYARAIELNPGSPYPYYNRASIFRRSNKYTLALHDYTMAIQRKPDLVQAYVFRARLHYLTRQYDDAWADVTQVRKLGGTLNPQFIQALVTASGRSELQ